jgi:hypothetical protein
MDSTDDTRRRIQQGNRGEIAGKINEKPYLPEKKVEVENRPGNRRESPGRTAQRRRRTLAIGGGSGE